MMTQEAQSQTATGLRFASALSRKTDTEAAVRDLADAVRIGKRRHIWMAAIAAPAISAGLQALEETHLPCGAQPAEALAALCR